MNTLRARRTHVNLTSMLRFIKRLSYPWFRKSEGYLKTDVVYLAHGGFWLVIGQGVAMASGLLLSLAFAHFLPKEAFGTYKFVLSGVAILGVFSLTGFNTSVIQSVAKGFGGALKQGFRLNLYWSAAVFVGGLALGIYYFIQGNNLLSYSFILAGIFSPISTSAALYAAFLLGKKDFKRSSFYGMVRNAAPTIVLILAILISQSLPIIITIYFVIGALVPLLLYWWTVRVYKNENKNEDPDLISYTGHLSVMDIIGNVARNLDKILIFHYLGAVPLALYAFAIAPVEQLQGGKKILSTLVLPKVSERSFEELQKSAGQKTLLLTVYALALAGAYALIAPYFYKYLFPQYLDSVLYSQIYSLTLLAISGTIFNEVLVAHKKKKELYAHRTIVPLVQIGLFVVLLPTFGLMGLIVSHVIIRSFSALLGFYFLRHPFKTTAADIENG